MKPKQLDYATPQLGHRTWVILPFIPLVFALVEIIWENFLVFLLVVGAGDDKGMTAADRAETQLLTNLATVTVYVGLLVGLLLGGLIAIRFRRYRVIPLACAAIGIFLCLLPFLLSIFGHFDLLLPFAR